MTSYSFEAMLSIALGHHQAGRLAEAEEIYRRILAQVPDHAGALHWLGCVAFQTGHLDAAIELISRAVTIEPAAAAYHCNLGESYRQAGQPERAIAGLRRAIELEPRFADAHNKLGAALMEAGRTDESVAAFRRAIELNPDFAEAYSDLGSALAETGAFDDAIAAYRRAIELKPGFAEAHSNLGKALAETGALDEAIAVLRRAIELKPDFAKAHIDLANALTRTGALDEAIAAYRRAIDLNPDFAEAHSHLGNALTETGALDEAITAHRRAIELKPDSAECHCNLGGALAEIGAVDEAIGACRRAIELKPDLAEAHGNLGAALQKTGQIDEAIATLRRAVALKPSFAEGHLNLALLLLLRGDFREGWVEHEWLWRVKDFASPRRSYPQPQWDGSDLADRTILLHCEHGFGDAIQFIRYVPLVAERCGRVIVSCRPELHRLFQSTPEVAQWVAPGEPLPLFDAHCPLMSLPLALGTTVQTIPRSVPYLQVDSRAIERWRERLAHDPGGLKVGLAWAGSSAHKNDRNRSLPLSLLAPWAQVQGVAFYSLQKGEAAGQAKDSPGGMNLIDWTEALGDFADTAALVANLDLVISVDTAVVHLAGALGRPVWVLAPFMPDWRWLLEREDSPWYPTVRLFRQKTAGRWDEVIERVAECLALERGWDAPREESASRRA
jgi:tetratricopeptide (TPR) repeat protein